MSECGKLNGKQLILAKIDPLDISKSPSEWATHDSPPNPICYPQSATKQDIKDKKGIAQKDCQGKNYYAIAPDGASYSCYWAGTPNNKCIVDYNFTSAGIDKSCNNRDTLIKAGYVFKDTPTGFQKLRDAIYYSNSGIEEDPSTQDVYCKAESKCAGGNTNTNDEKTSFDTSNKSCKITTDYCNWEQKNTTSGAKDKNKQPACANACNDILKPKCSAIDKETATKLLKNRKIQTIQGTNPDRYDLSKNPKCIDKCINTGYTGNDVKYAWCGTSGEGLPFYRGWAYCDAKCKDNNGDENFKYLNDGLDKKDTSSNVSESCCSEYAKKIGYKYQTRSWNDIPTGCVKSVNPGAKDVWFNTNANPSCIGKGEGCEGKTTTKGTFTVVSDEMTDCKKKHKGHRGNKGSDNINIVIANSGGGSPDQPPHEYIDPLNYTSNPPGPLNQNPDGGSGNDNTDDQSGDSGQTPPSQTPPSQTPSGSTSSSVVVNPPPKSSNTLLYVGIGVVVLLLLLFLLYRFYKKRGLSGQPIAPPITQPIRSM